MTYRDVKNLPRRKAANKVLRDKAFKIGWISTPTCFIGFISFLTRNLLNQTLQVVLLKVK